MRVIQLLILAWFKRHGRSLPWREKTLTKGLLRDPYRILVSELMLQQTQVARVIPKYTEFLDKWPTFSSLSQASLSDVLILWKGLGYNKRAKYLLETAKIIHHEYEGVFPKVEEKRKFPGIGDYTKSALFVFAFGKDDVVIDTNISRIIWRVWFGVEQVSNKEIAETARQVIPNKKADMWHQALMDFGALVCTARLPTCEACVLKDCCQANKQAQKEGYLSFRAWLMDHPQKKKITGKDTGKRFEETDRYFRGKIIDCLRGGAMPMSVLWQRMETELNFHDRKRFGELIESLRIDGLISILRTMVQLA